MVNAQCQAAFQWIRERIATKTPRVGLILGSGMGSLADSISNQVVFPYQSIPGFPHSKVPGHASQLILGTIRDTEVIAMNGRAHLYEGWSVHEATMPVRVMARLGIELLIVSNASGGVNLRFRSGQIVVIDQQLQWMFRSAISPDDVANRCSSWGIPNRNTLLYDPTWLERAESCAIANGFSLPRGTYLATLGPNYETRAEYRAFARMGADMVGMSTVPETMLAAALGVPTLAFSIITNVARPDAPTTTSHEEVLELSKVAQAQLVPLVQQLITDHFPSSNHSSTQLT